MKYLKIKPFKELQAIEIDSGSDSDKIEVIETRKATAPYAGSKRVGDSAHDASTSDIKKKIKLEDSIGGGDNRVISTVQVLGHDLLYKQHGESVLFKTSSVLDLLSAKMPYQQSSTIESIVDKSKASTDNSKDFKPWNHIKYILNGGLLDLSIREAFVRIGNQEDTNEQNVITLNNKRIKFKVKNGCVYLDVVSALTALGHYGSALSGDWSHVDLVLANAEVSLKAAFKRRATGDCPSASLGRDYITFQAYSLLCTSDTDEDVRIQVSKLKETIDSIKAEGKRICREFQQTVNMILRMSCIVPIESSNDENESKGDRDRKTGVKSTRCCAKPHKFTIAEQEIGYVRKFGKVYLENFAAFALIGRLYVIRCTDYTKPDQILLKKSGKNSIDEFYLFDGECGTRSHISLDGFVLLLESGYDVSCHDDLLQTVNNIRSTFQQSNRRTSCEDFETIDLSSSEVESDDTKERGIKETSSGLESEDGTPVMVRKRTVSFQDYDSDEDIKMEFPHRQISDFVELLGAQIPVREREGALFVDKNALLKVADMTLQYGLKNLDKILETSSAMDDSTVYKGKNKMFLSLEALKTLLMSDEMMSYEAKDSLLQEISVVLNTLDSERTQILQLETFDDLKFKLVNGVVYLDTQKLLKLGGFSASYFNQPTTKTNLFLCRILSERGVNTQHCFHKYGKSKYAFLSLAAASVLLRSDIGPLKDNNISALLIEDIIEALTNRNIILSPNDKQEMTIQVLEDFQPIKYKILDGQLFLHRKMSFECLGLENSVLSGRKGYATINNILKQCNVNVEKCYLGSRQQKYCYISSSALMKLLHSQDPMIICLGVKDNFLGGLLRVLQESCCAIMAPNSQDSEDILEIESDEPLDVRMINGLLYLKRDQAFRLSGLDEQESLMEDVLPDDLETMLEERGVDPMTSYMTRGHDTRGWISLHCLYFLMNQTIMDLTVNKDSWRDILSAVFLYEPKIKAKLKIISFKEKLIKKLESFFVEHSSCLVENANGLTTQFKQESSQTTKPNQLSLPIKNHNLDVVRKKSNDQIVPGSDVDLNSPQPPSNLHSPSTSCFPSPTETLPDFQWITNCLESCPLSPSRYASLRRDILDQPEVAGDVFIGDWRLDLVEDSLLKLSVKSGYGASRKVSFINPDFAAILRYSLILTPETITLSINEKNVDGLVIEKILNNTEREGTFSFLVQMISLRPCFGSFSPELVETVSQSMARPGAHPDLDRVFIDNNFIGSSSCGRTYAGTVRHKECNILAFDRVSDVCKRCREISSLTINRSVLVSDNVEKSVETSSQELMEKGQKSVWKLATTSSDGCSFVCPQVQSFNTSLPHAFDGRSQAAAIVSHKVEIKNDLDVQVHLCDRKISSSYSEFQKTRQLGPLLDWVAGLRLCVGYPSTTLLSQAQFILDNLENVNPEMRKLFSHMYVDKGFEYKMCGDGSRFTGCIRSSSCLTRAETNSDICKMCRTLQEPMEFLSMN